MLLLRPNIECHSLNDTVVHCKHVLDLDKFYFYVLIKFRHFVNYKAFNDRPPFEVPINLDSIIFFKFSLKKKAVEVLLGRVIMIGR